MWVHSIRVQIHESIVECQWLLRMLQTLVDFSEPVPKKKKQLINRDNRKENLNEKEKNNNNSCKRFSSKKWIDMKLSSVAKHQTYK